MKLVKPKPTQLEKVMRTLDSVGAQYLKADVKAQDQVEKKEIETIVLLLGAVFEKRSGKYMFACPVANPMTRNGVP